MTEGGEMSRPKQCPECGSNDVIPIQYGIPGPEMFKEWEAGKIELGGCVITGDDPNWYCKKCGHRWKYLQNVIQSHEDKPMSRHKELKKLWKDRPKDPELFECFCYFYRCPHRDYSLCPKDCEKPGLKDRCVQEKCQIKLQDPEECQKIISELQKKARVKPFHVVK